MHAPAVSTTACPDGSWLESVGRRAEACIVDSSAGPPCQQAHPPERSSLAGYCWLTAAGLLLWFYWRPFGRFLRVRWRRWSIYRYKWPATMDFADLDRYRSDGRQYAPVLGKVTCTQTVDVVRARMLAGQVEPY